MRKLCTVLALPAILIALLLPAGIPGAAQKEKATGAVAVFGTKGAGDPLTISGIAQRLGSDEPMAGLKLLVLAKMKDGKNVVANCKTDKAGKFSIVLHLRPKELRVYAYGDLFIPEAWSNIPVALFKADRDWTVKVRTLTHVDLRGKITVPGLDRPADRAQVWLAPLDVAQDGTLAVFEEPFSTRGDDDGEYTFNVPAGHYRLWAWWADRDTDDWDGYIGVVQEINLFGDVEQDFTLELGPMLEGRVTDARTGEGVAAEINLWSSLYLKQLRNLTADGETPDDRDADGKDILWPKGTFKFRVWMVDPSDFTVVIRPAMSDQMLKVIPDQDAHKLAGAKISWKLYSPEMKVVDLVIQTHEQEIPVNGIDIRLVPRKLEVPPHLRMIYTAGGITDERGELKLVGLAQGVYDVYGAGNSTLFGELRVEGSAPQRVIYKYEIPFATGTIKYPDGSLCKDARVRLEVTRPGGGEPWRGIEDAFGHSDYMRAQGKLFIRMLLKGATFKLRFLAHKPGTKTTPYQQLIREFEYISEPISFKIEGEKAYLVDLTLKKNPDYKKPD